MILPVVSLYTRPRCSLCQHAVSILVAEGIGFNEIDISKDPFLEKEFGIFVPVVQVDGRTVFEAGMNPRDLPAQIADHLPGR